MLFVFFLSSLGKEISAFLLALILEKSVERGFIVQDIGFTGLSKNLSLTLRLGEYFLEVLWNQ